MLARSPVSVTNWIAKIAGAIVAILGVAVLFGWALGIAFLKTILPNSKQMAPSTALCLIVAFLALWSVTGLDVPASDEPHQPKPGSFRRWLAAVSASAIALVGILKLIECGAGNIFGIDTLLFAHDPNPTQMAPATALSFTLFGAALLLCRTRFLGSFQLLSLFGGFVSWLALSQYVYGGQPLVSLDAMAVHTAAAFFILNVAILCVRPDYGLMELLTSDSPGGVVSRRLVPAALFVPTILGWLEIKAQRAGWYGAEAGVSLFALSNILVFGGLIWKNAALLNGTEAQRKRAERRVHAQLERLSLLQQITRAISDRQDMQSIFQAALQRLEDQLLMDFCCVCLYDAPANQLTVTAVGPKSGALAVALALSPGTAIAIGPNGLSRCVEGHLVYEPDVERVQFPFPQQLAKADLRALVAVPLLVESQLFGLLVVSRRLPESFTSGDCEFLKQLSEHVVLAAHQAELHSALKQAYDELRMTQEAVMQQERLRALGQMASGIAHDINNAISPVALYTELLLEKEQNLSQRAREYLEITQRAIEDVSHTIGRMREFYRRQEPELPLEPVDLNQIVRQVVDLTRARWSDMPLQRGLVIEVHQDLMPQLPAVSAIESEVREALTNLIFNAVDAMPEGGALTLKTISTPDTTGPGLHKVRLEVSDTGDGMDEETRRRCLEPFYTTKGERGTGLGLAMVYGIARRHNADLQIESEIGKGTTVSLVFPPRCCENPHSP